MSSPSTHALFILTLVIQLTYGTYQDCGYKFSSSNVTFDLSSLILTRSSPLNYDSVISGGYTWAFNLCNNVINPTSIGPACHNFTDKAFVDPNGNTQTRPKEQRVAVYQLNNIQGLCFKLSGGVNETAYNVSQNLISYELYDPADPALGVTINYGFGDQCFGSTTRQTSISFICDANIANIQDSEISISEAPTCNYNIEIKSIYGCPLECARGINGSLCSNLGVCGYDFDQQTARCYCYAGYEGDACELEAKFYGQKAWYDAIETDNDSIVYEFQTEFGYNVTYDLKYLIDGYLNDKYYKLPDNDGSDTIYFNLLSNLSTEINNDNTLCINNEDTYDYGYIFETTTDAPGAQCYSLGRNTPIIELYDATIPTKGIKVTFENGDDPTGSGWCSNGASSVVNFICPDSNRYERFDALNGLNYEFVNYTFSELLSCQREVEIFTSAACPYQCITYDINKDALSQCTANGICAHDFALDVTRCICNDNVNISKPADIFCENPDITYSPSSPPTEEPTLPPFVTYYQDVTVDETSDYLVTLETIYGYNITYDLQYIVQGYDSDIDGVFTGYKFTDYWGRYAYYVNLFDRINHSAALIELCLNHNASYDYGYVFRADNGGPHETCYSAGRQSNIALYDESNPSQGITISYTLGDDEGCSYNRQTEINFICPQDGGEFERFDKTSGFQEVYNSNKFGYSQCGPYSIDIYTSAACPAKCITYDAAADIISVCKTNGVCEYKDSFGLVKCECFGNAPILSAEDIFCPNENITYPPTTPEPSYTPTMDPTPEPTILAEIVDFYENNKANESSPYVFTFDTGDYNVSYDLSYLMDGYLDGKYFKLSDNGAHDYYFNLFDNSLFTKATLSGICGTGNPNSYEFGYIFQAVRDDPDAPCYSLGRIGPEIGLYDIDDPLKGISIAFENGDGLYCQPRETVINFVCPSSNTDGYQVYDDLNGLNDIFASKYTFNEPFTCSYNVTIVTAAACPYQCAYRDNEEKSSISLCSTNGECIYDSNIDVVRCECDDGIVMDSVEDAYCAQDATYPPTNIPTSEPTDDPTPDPTRTRNPTMEPTEAPTETYGFEGDWSHYNVEDDVSWQVIIETDYYCEYVKFTTIIPTCNSGVEWFGFGIGGTYDIASSEEAHEEDDETLKMNGYALITVVGANSTWETTLSPETANTGLILQDSQDLNCEVIMDGCIQTNICYRTLYDGDDEDFTEFVAGDNPIAWAYGAVRYDGQILQHQNAEADLRDKIYLDGDGGCLAEITSTKITSTTEDNIVLPTATEDVNIVTVTMDRQGVNEGDDTDGDGIWMIIGIIFIILFVIILIILVYVMYKNKQNGGTSGYVSHGRMDSNEAMGTTQLATFDDDINSPQLGGNGRTDNTNEDDGLL